MVFGFSYLVSGNAPQPRRWSRVSDNAWDFDLALKSTKVRLQNMATNVPEAEEAQEAIRAESNITGALNGPQWLCMCKNS